MKLICKYCGKEYESGRKNKYCSDECRKNVVKDRNRNRYKPRESTKHECKQCGKAYYGHKSKIYCSVECRNEARKIRIRKIRIRKGTTKGRSSDIDRVQNQINRLSSKYEVIGSKKHKIFLYCKDCGSCFSIYRKAVLYKNSAPGCRKCNEILKQARQDAKEKERAEKILKRIRISAERERRFVHTCKECGKTYCDHKRPSYCSDECAKKAARRDREYRKRIRDRKVTHFITLRQIADRDKDICHICGKKVDWNDYKQTEYFIAGDNYPSVDHLKPLSKGGQHAWNNIKLAHRRCNSVKCANDVYVGKNGQMEFAL